VCLPMPGIPQFDDVSHSQSTMFESGKSELQDKHNMNESGTDRDILRSPSGSSHQAGCEPTACRKGIQVSEFLLPFNNLYQACSGPGLREVPVDTFQLSGSR